MNEHADLETAARAALADAEPDVFWTARPERPSARPALTGGGHRCDLLIVGGGFTGLWAAIHAKRADPGRSVTVLEAGRLGVGASGRNGGFISPSLTHGLAQGLRQWPYELDLLQRLGEENFTGLRADVAAFGIDADLHVPGELVVSLNPLQDNLVRESYEQHHQRGDDVTLLDAPATRARVSSPVYRCSYFDPNVGLVDPARLVWGLAEASERLGVSIHEDTAVRGFETDGTGLRVRTEWGAAHAAKVVVGTNASRGVLRRFSAFVLPVYDLVLMSEPLTATQLAEIGWTGREGLTDAGNQFHYYRRTFDDRVLFGGYDANYHFPGRLDPRHEQSEATHGLLARHFLRIFPQLDGIRFTHRWGGVIDTTSRFTPFFGTAFGGRMSYAVGYTGLGVGSTRWGAQVALDLVDGRRTESTELEMVRRKPVPFPPEPIRSLAVAATRRALATEDRTGRRGVWLGALDRLGVGFDS